MSYVKTTQEWLEYFKANERVNLKIPFDTYQLTTDEKKLITKSIQSFQLGESSTGNNLKRYARDYAERFDCPYYADLMNLFIKEENRHSSYLWQFMRQHNIPRAKETTNDSIFRYLRSLLGIETSIRVLVTAETIALTYYKVLGDATDSPVLKKICGHMLKEEKDHLRFQMQHIQMINRYKSDVFSFLTDTLHMMFIFITCMAVWHEHKEVLSTQYCFTSFAMNVLGHFFPALIKGREDAAVLAGDNEFSKKEVTWA